MYSCVYVFKHVPAREKKKAAFLFCGLFVMFVLRSIIAGID